MDETVYKERQKHVMRISRKFLPLFLKIEVLGKEYLKNARKPLIFAANHKSYLDQFILMYVLGDCEDNILPIRSLTSNFFMGTPIIGKLMASFGAFTAKKSGFASVLKEPINILKSGGTVGIYPEGKICCEHGINEIKNGIGLLAKKSRAPILPAAIIGLDNFSLWQLPLLFFKKRKVIVAFGEMLRPEINKTVDEIVTEFKNKLIELYTAHPANG